MKVISDTETFDLGVSEARPTISITDYSRRTTDEFGATTVVKRGFSRKLSVRVLVASNNVDALQDHLASLRATSALWVADESSEWLSVQGFFKEFEVDLALPPVSYCTLAIEGLAETELAPDPGGDPAPAGRVSTLKMTDEGVEYALGVTEASPTAGITDYSRKEFDEFGDPVIVERAFAKRMNVRALIETDKIDLVANRIAAVRAKPVQWEAASEYQVLQIEGFWKEFSIERGDVVSLLTLSIEGLSTAEDPVVFGDLFTGIQTDRDPTPAPTGPKIGSLYYDGNNKPYRFEGRPLFNGLNQLFYGESPLLGSGWVSVRDKGLTEIVDDLQSLDDDGTLTTVEKRIAIERDRQLENIYQGILQQANSLGYTATSLIDARASYIAIRNSIVPAWNDLTQPSNFSGTGWDAVLDLYESELADAQADMAATTGVTVVPPAAQEIRLDTDGTAKTGDLPRTLTPVVKRGATDIRTSDDTSYLVSTTGDLVATVSNVADVTKGRITVTAGTEGTVELTVTVRGVDFGPFPIKFIAVPERPAASFASNTYSFEVLTAGGETILFQGGTNTVGPNSTQNYTFAAPYAIPPCVTVSGNSTDLAREGNAGLVGNPTTTGFTANNTTADTITINWQAVGKK